MRVPIGPVAVLALGGIALWWIYRRLYTESGSRRLAAAPHSLAYSLN